MNAAALSISFLLDLIFGDPVYWFHPVRIFGRVIEKGENILRRIPMPLKVSGVLLSLLLPVFVFGLSLLLWTLFQRIHPYCGLAANIAGIYACLSIHDLRKEILRVQRDLMASDLEAARRSVARIVGRDTGNMDRTEIIRAAIETTAESTLDGIVAPLFYAALGGAPLALAYKAVNTLDSMIGHRNEKYRDFGWFAAKQDEAWNWFPARLCYVVIALASLIRFQSFEAGRIGWKDGILKNSGNGAIPESCFAGALRVRLGGENFYAGRSVFKPTLGSGDLPQEIELIPRALTLMILSACLSLILCLELPCLIP